MAETNEDRTAEVKSSTWRFIGEEHVLCRTKCHHLYAKSGKKYDVALFYHEEKFYAMSAWCSHMGGPLYQGQIEDYNGKCNVMCPWHSYMFELETGANNIGLQQDVFDVKTVDGKVYVQHESELCLGSYVITVPSK